MFSKMNTYKISTISLHFYHSLTSDISQESISHPRFLFILYLISQYVLLFCITTILRMLSLHSHCHLFSIGHHDFWLLLVLSISNFSLPSQFCKSGSNFSGKGEIVNISSIKSLLQQLNFVVPEGKQPLTLVRRWMWHAPIKLLPKKAVDGFGRWVIVSWLLL